MVEWETLSKEKTLLKQELHNKEESHITEKNLLEKKVSEVEEEVSALTSALGVKENELMEQLANFTKQVFFISSLLVKICGIASCFMYHETKG